MDSTAVTLAMDNGLPIVVFALMGEGNVVRAIRGEAVGTLVCDAGPQGPRDPGNAADRADDADEYRADG